MYTNVIRLYMTDDTTRAASSSSWSKAPPPAAPTDASMNNVETLQRNLQLAISTANEMQAKFVQCNRKNEQLIRERNELKSELVRTKRTLARSTADAQLAVAQAEASAQKQLAEQSRLHIKEMSAALSRSQDEVKHQMRCMTELAKQQQHRGGGDSSHVGGLERGSGGAATTGSGSGVVVGRGGHGGHPETLAHLETARARIKELEAHGRMRSESEAAHEEVVRELKTARAMREQEGVKADKLIAEMKQRVSLAEATVRKVKSASLATEARAKQEYQALQKQALLFSLQFERQCVAMGKLSQQQHHIDDAADAARTIQERETLAVQHELDEATAGHDRLRVALKRKEDEHRIEVQCRSAATAEVRQLRLELSECREVIAEHERARALRNLR